MEMLDEDGDRVEVCDEGTRKFHEQERSRYASMHAIAQPAATEGLRSRQIHVRLKDLHTGIHKFCKLAQSERPQFWHTLGSTSRKRAPKPSQKEVAGEEGLFQGGILPGTGIW